MNNIIPDTDNITLELENIDRGIAWCRVAEGEHKGKLVFMPVNTTFVHDVMGGALGCGMFEAKIRNDGKVNYLEF